MTLTARNTNLDISGPNSGYLTRLESLRSSHSPPQCHTGSFLTNIPPSSPLGLIDLMYIYLIQLLPVRARLRGGFVLYIVLLCTSVHAQSPVIPTDNFASRLWTTENGLPVDDVYDIAQTQDGYIWLATPSGLARFDGLTFTTFTAIDHPALPSNHIRRLFADSSGRLWIMTILRDLVLYEDGTFTRMDARRGFPHRLTDFLIFTNPIYEADDGTIWVTHTGGISQYHDGQLTPFFPDQLQEQVTTLYWDPKGTLWIGDNEEQIWRYDANAGLQRILSRDDFLRVRQQTLGDNDEPPFWPWNMYEDPLGRFWIATEGGAFIYAEGGLSLYTTYHGDLLRLPPRHVFVDDQNRIWFDNLYAQSAVVTHDRIIWPYGDKAIVNHKGRPFERAVSNPNWTHFDAAIYFKSQEQFQFPQGTEARDFLEDQEGNFWVASSRGLLQLRHTPIAVTNHRLPNGGTSFALNAYPILQDQTGAVWIGAPRNNLLKFSGTEIDLWTYNPPHFHIGHPWTLLEDRRGTLWVGGYGLFAIDEPTRSAVRISPDIPDKDIFKAAGLTPSIGEIRTIIEDASGTFWAGGETGLARGIPGQPWYVFSTNDGYTPFWTQALLQSQNQSIWIGTFGQGLYRYRNGAFQHWNTENGFCSNNITSIYEDVDEQNLWITTSDQGICRLTNYAADSLIQAKVASLSSHHGLHNSSVHVLLEDDFDRYWMSSPKGIFWVPKTDLNAVADQHQDRVVSVVYDDRDGMNTKSTNSNTQPAGIKDDQGRLWFPTPNGVVTIDPAIVEQHGFLPPVHIETATIDGTIYDMPTALTLEPHQRALSMTYTALSYVKSAGIQFQYRLVGLNDTWQNAGTSRTLQFTNLDPGTYTFEVKAANSSGVWNESPARLTILRQPFFYETALFNAFLVLGALLGGIGLFRYRTHRIRKQNLELEIKVEERTEALEHALVRVGEQAKELKALDETKSQFFANVSHEFRTPLTLIRGHVADVYEARYGSLSPRAEQALSKSLTQTHRLQILVEQLLDLSRLEANHLELHPKRGDLNVFLKQRVNYFSSLAEKHGISLRYQGTHGVVETLFDAEKMEKVITNLVGNAVKFTPTGGSIQVTLHCSEGVGNVPRQATIVVADTGIGMAPEVLPHVFKRFYQADATATRSYEGIGVGLALAKDLIELHGGTIQVQSEINKGATFTLVLPAPPVPQVQPISTPAAEVSALFPATPISPTSENTAPFDVKGRILVVDDNAEIRSYLLEHLRESFDVFEAEDGQAAWDFLQETSVDALVSDVMMPRMDGFTLLEKLKTHEQLHTTPILILTARADEEDRLRGLEAKADAYLAKPFKIAELQLVVRNLVNARQAMQQQYQQQVVAVHADQLDLKDEDSVFLERAKTTVEQYLHDPLFTVEEMTKQLHMSRMTLNRRLKAMTNLSPVAYIRKLRLERARQMLEQSSTQTVAEVAVAVGYKDAAYFSRAYSKAYGVPPSVHASRSSAQKTDP